MKSFKKLTNSELILLRNKEQDDLNSILIGKYIYYIESEKKLNHDDNILKFLISPLTVGDFVEYSNFSQSVLI